MPWLLIPALLMVLMAALTAVMAQRLESRFPPIGELVEVDGLRVHHTDSGPTPGALPIVLLHGASTSLLDFHASLVGPLAQTHRVITIDRPGHGYSDRPDGDWPDPADQADLLHQTLRALDVERPLLVGHSWAGSLVLAYLLRHPDSAAGGVLLAGGSHPWQGGVAWYNDLAAVPVLGRLFAHTVPLTLGRLTVDDGIRATFAPNAMPPDYRARTGVELTLRPRTFLANAEDVRLLSPFLERQSSHYAYLRQPLLLITGDADGVVPSWNHTDRLIREASNAERVVLDDTGHGLHHVHTERIARLITNFAQRIAP